MLLLLNQCHPINPDPMISLGTLLPCCKLSIPIFSKFEGVRMFLTPLVTLKVYFWINYWILESLFWGKKNNNLLTNNNFDV